jgi:chaperonin GroEL (HSP60 family)
VKEKKARVEDAMHATKASAEEGLVPGDVALLRGSAVLSTGETRVGRRPTETDIEGNKARVKDAMHATKAAAEEGLVPGGVALLRGSAVPSTGETRVGRRATDPDLPRSGPKRQRDAAAFRPGVRVIK